MRHIQHLSGSSLKMIAIITMFIDHLGFSLIYYKWNQFYNLSRTIGRIAFPIFCFLLIEGFLHTRSRIKYARNLFLFALISELPFDLLFNAKRSIWHSQNVFFTLLIGLLVIWAMEKLSRYHVLLQVFPAAFGMLLAWYMKTDYSWKGIILIVVLYFFRMDRLIMTVAGSISLLWEWPAIFAFIPINLYNGTRGWMKGTAAKYAFYFFYPCHLLLLTAIRAHCIGFFLPLELTLL